MGEEYKGTSIEKIRGEDEFLEVEELIKETLAESKATLKKEIPAPPVKEKPAVAEEKPKAVAARPEEKKTPSPATAPSAPAAKSSPEAAKYEATFKEYKPGDIVKGTVLKVDPSGVLVDIKYKADALILSEELSDKSFGSPEEVVKVGDVIDVYIENLENKEGHVVISKKRADYEIRWKIAYDAFKNKKALEGKVIQALKGGLVVDCHGIRGFIPASQVQKKSGETLEDFKDKTVPVKIIEINRRQGKIVLSHKLAATEKEKRLSVKIFEELEAGQVRHGTVSSIKNFGAFVDIGGVEGLIHLSELSWKRVKHPSEVLKVGQDLDVYVLNVDRINKKVALGLKELQPDPWVNATEYYKPGQIVKAKILRFAKFGAFAELEHDLEGLIHISEISKEPVKQPEDAVKAGDVVDVKVLRVLPEEQKIGLSIREAISDKEKEDFRQATQTDEVKKVTIADMIAQKEKEKAEREAQIEETQPSEIQEAEAEEPT